MLQPLVLVEAFGLRSYARIYASAAALSGIALLVLLVAGSIPHGSLVTDGSKP